MIIIKVIYIFVLICGCINWLCSTDTDINQLGVLEIIMALVIRYTCS